MQLAAPKRSPVAHTHVETGRHARQPETENQDQRLGTRNSQTVYLFRTRAPIRNNFRTVPVGSPFI